MLVYNRNISKSFYYVRTLHHLIGINGNMYTIKHTSEPTTVLLYYATYKWYCLDTVWMVDFEPIIKISYRHGKLVLRSDDWILAEIRDVTFALSALLFDRHVIPLHPPSRASISVNIDIETI